MITSQTGDLIVSHAKANRLFFKQLYVVKFDWHIVRQLFSFRTAVFVPVFSLSTVSI